MTPNPTSAEVLHELENALGRLSTRPRVAVFGVGGKASNIGVYGVTVNVRGDADTEFMTIDPGAEVTNLNIGDVTLNFENSGDPLPPIQFILNEIRTEKGPTSRARQVFEALARGAPAVAAGLVLTKAFLGL